MLLQLQVWGLYLLQESGGVSFDPISMWKVMGWPAKCVVIGLFLMSAYSIGVMIDRFMAYNAARSHWVLASENVNVGAADGGRRHSKKSVARPYFRNRPLQKLDAARLHKDGGLHHAAGSFTSLAERYLGTGKA